MIMRKEGKITDGGKYFDNIYLRLIIATVIRMHPMNNYIRIYNKNEGKMRCLCPSEFQILFIY